MKRPSIHESVRRRASPRIGAPRAAKRPQRRSRAALRVLLCIAALSAGCEKGLRNMYEQPKNNPLTANALFADGSSARPLVTGTVPHSGGAAAYPSSGRLGEMSLPPDPGAPVPLGPSGEPLAAVNQVPTEPLHAPPVTRARVLRGQQRFDIYCSPCHGIAGDGDGRVARRGFPHPPTFHSDRLRRTPDSHFYAVITHGYGVMYPYGDRVAPDDRWAIVSYIRALQLSQSIAVSDLPPTDAAKLPERR